MNRSYFCVYDFETGSKNPNKTQPTQLGAVIVDNKKLEIISSYNSFIKPATEEVRIANGLEEISDEALEKTHIKREQLDSAPPIKIVWEQFSSWVNQYNFKKNKWDAPIKVGYNNNGFDDIIIDRICGSEPYKFGPWDDERGKESLFHPIYNIDVLKVTFLFFENKIEPKSLSLDSMRQYLGLANEAGHSADYDAKQTAQIFIRYLRLIRKVSLKTNFKDAFIRNL